MQQYYDLLDHCRKGDNKAQRMLYDLFKARLMGLCRRYTRNREEAQDVLQESFIKIFSKIHQLQESERLESWVKSITVRTAIDFYHKNKKKEAVIFTEIDIDQEDFSVEEAVAHISDEYLVAIINELPDGCRVIFNLYEVEGYSHQEIAVMLNISDGTSRSQLHQAKYLLKNKLKKNGVTQYYERLAR